MNEKQFFDRFQTWFDEIKAKVEHEVRWHRDFIMPRLVKAGESQHQGTRKHVDNAAGREHGITRRELGDQLVRIEQKLDQILSKEQ